MSFLTLAYFEFKSNLKQPINLVIFVVIPLLISWILGMAYGDSMTMDISGNNRLMVYIGDKNSDLAQAFESFLESEPVSRIMTVTEVNSKEKALEAVEKEDYTGYIIFPEISYEMMASGEAISIEYFAKVNQQVIQSLLESYVDGTNLFVSVYENGYIDEQLSLDVDESVVVRKSINQDNSFPRAIDYYAVQSLLQMLTFAALTGVMSITKEYESDVFIRTTVSPTSSTRLLMSKIVGNTLYMFLAVILAVLLSKFVMGTNITGDYFMIFVGFSLFVILNVGLGMILGILFKNFIVTMGIIMVYMMVTSSLAGSITPMVTDPVLQTWTPNYYAKNIIFGSIYQYDSGVMAQSVVILLVMAAVAVGLSVLLQRRIKV